MENNQDIELEGLIRKIIITHKFPEFMYWLLASPKYGVCNLSGKADTASIMLLNSVCKLYRNWIRTKKEPSQGEWEIARINNIPGSHLAFAASNAAFVNLNTTNPVTTVLAIMEPIHRTLLNDPKLAHINKLKELLEYSKNDDLFTELDYEKE